jgi:hypothetical protein
MSRSAIGTLDGAAQTKEASNNQKRVVARLISFRPQQTIARPAKNEEARSTIVPGKTIQKRSGVNIH